MKFRRYIAWRFIFALVVLLATVGVFLFGTHGNAERANTLCDTDQRVFDYGDYLSDDGEAQLASLISGWEKSCRTDLILYTDSAFRTDDDVVPLVQEFFLDHDFGWDRSNGDAVLLYFNMSTRYVYVLTSGRAIGIVNSQHIYDRIVDLVGDQAKQGDYYQGFVDGFERIRWHMLLGKYVPAPFLYLLIFLVGTVTSCVAFLARQMRNLASVPVEIDDYLVSSQVMRNTAQTTRTQVIHHARSGGGGGGGFHIGGGGGGGGGPHFGGGGGHF